MLDSVVEELAAAVVMTEANDRKSVDTVRRCLAKLREVVRSDCASEDLIALADACIALETRLKASETETDAEALAALSDAVGRLQSCAAATAKWLKRPPRRHSRVCAQSLGRKFLIWPPILQ